MNFNDACRAVCEGRISFAQFAILTRSLWGYLAERMMRRWPPGPGVAIDDVTQDLLVAAWESFGRYDARRGVAVNKYVLFNAIDRAKKQLHRSRGAGQARDHGASRVPLPGRNWSVEDDRVVLGKAAKVVEIESLLDHKRTLEQYMAGLTREDRVVVEALVAAGSCGAAAVLIYNRYQDRLRLRLGSDEAAERYVVRVVERLGGKPPVA